MERLSLWELCERNVDGGTFTGDSVGCVKEGSEDGHLCLHKGPPGRGLIYQGLVMVDEGGL